ncbi:transposase family protein [Chloroflexales bacterium ZM16-3]|nr:transposase family protein [Chloroflexales bacterium ZM16-3]
MAQPTDKPEGDSFRRRKPKRRRPLDIDALNKRDKKRLEKRGKTPKRLKEIERVIKPLVEIVKTQGSLRGTGERNKAATALGVSVWTIDNWVDAYLADPRVESLADKQPGREKGRMLSSEQEDIACFFFINPKLNTVYPDGRPDNIPEIANVKYIYAVIQKFCPEPKWTIDTLRRYLNDLKAEHPLVIDRAHKGENYLRNKLLPARKNNVDRPNQRWQMDARPLPIYVNYDGMICTVTLLQMIDDYSWYPVRHRLIPRKIRDEEGLPKGADFTSGDVGILLASAMYYEQIRPEDLYTDNGSQIIAIEEFLEDLTDENETLIRMRNSIPGRPRGRGKIEKFLGLMDELLKDLPANFVGKEKDLAAVGAARRVKNMLSFEEFCTIFDK